VVADGVQHETAREDERWRLRSTFGLRKTLKAEAQERYRGERNPVGQVEGMWFPARRKRKNVMGGLARGMAPPETSAVVPSDPPIRKR
jgi:hypothetical protein